MIHSFPKGISPTVNVIEQFGFELAYSGVRVQYASHYAVGTPLQPPKIDFFKKKTKKTP